MPYFARAHRDLGLDAAPAACERVRRPPCAPRWGASLDRKLWQATAHARGRKPTRSACGSLWATVAARLGAQGHRITAKQARARWRALRRRNRRKGLAETDPPPLPPPKTPAGGPTPTSSASDSTGSSEEAKDCISAGEREVSDASGAVVGEKRKVRLQGWRALPRLQPSPMPPTPHHRLLTCDERSAHHPHPSASC